MKGAVDVPGEDSCVVSDLGLLERTPSSPDICASHMSTYVHL